MRRSTYMMTAAALLALPLSAQAQQTEAQRSTTLSLSGGAMQYELQGGSGTTALAALRLNVPFGRMFSAELGAVGAMPRQQFGVIGQATGAEGERALLAVLPEAQLQVQVPLGRIAPYAGIGGGLVIDRADRRDGTTLTEFSGSAAGGVRVALADRVGGVAEVRYRGLGQDFEHRTTEFTLGLSWQLKRTQHLF